MVSAAAAAAGDLTLEGEMEVKSSPGPERQRCRLDIQVSGCGKTSKPSYGQRGEKKKKTSMCFSSRSQMLMNERSRRVGRQGDASVSV